MSMISKVVMVVDDETEMLSLVASHLRRHGLAVMTVPSAERALHLVKSMRPNLFLLDIMMPGIDGFELCKRLRTTPHTQNIPVIMFSILDTPQSRATARSCGADAFVPKSFSFSELVTQINSLLSRNGANGTGYH